MTKIKVLNTTLKEWDSVKDIFSTVELKCPKCQRPIDLNELDPDLSDDKKQEDYQGKCWNCELFLMIPVKVTTQIQMEFFEDEIKIDDSFAVDVGWTEDIPL